MKKDFKISRLAIICVLCTTVSGAYAAFTVRTLGGAGTYDSVSSASSSSGTSSATARGGTVRISPTASSSSSSSGRVTTTTPRLSIGKYLGGGTSVSGGSTIISQKPGGNASGGSSDGSMDPGVASDLEKQIEAVREDVTRLGDDVKDVQDNKQNILGTGDDYISIENDEIFG